MPATMAGKTTAVFSLEMPKDQLAMRLLCADARVDMQAGSPRLSAG